MASEAAEEKAAEKQSEKALKQGEKDNEALAKAREDDEAYVRGTVEGVGGQSFSYGKPRTK